MGTTLAEVASIAGHRRRRRTGPARRLFRRLGRRRRGVEAPLDPVELRRAGRALRLRGRLLPGRRPAASASRRGSSTTWQAERRTVRAVRVRPARHRGRGRQARLWPGARRRPAAPRGLVGDARRPRRLPASRRRRGPAPKRASGLRRGVRPPPAKPAVHQRRAPARAPPDVGDEPLPGQRAGSGAVGGPDRLRRLWILRRAAARDDRARRLGVSDHRPLAGPALPREPCPPGRRHVPGPGASPHRRRRATMPKGRRRGGG